MIELPSHSEWLRGGAYALAMGLPLSLSYFVNAPDILAYMAMGAMFSLRLDPHRSPKRQAAAILGGMLLMIASAGLGVLLVGHKGLSIAALVLIAYLAGQPKSDQAYLSLLTKFIAAAMLLADMGLPTNAGVALAYFVGAIWAFMLSLLGDWLQPDDNSGWSPADELHRLMAGDINGPLFGLTLPITILAATLTADMLHAQHAAWVGLTVLFVMHVNDANTWTRLRQRMIGTLLGVGLAYVAVLWLPRPLFPPLITILALLIPTLLRQSYQWFSLLITLVVLLVIDIAMTHQGGDLTLLRWRFFDTLIGCMWVAIALVLLRFGKKHWPQNMHG